MSVNVIEFPLGRTAAPDYRQCECGSAWFTLVRETSDGPVSGAISVALDGTVIGYSGVLACNDCGKRH